MTLGKRADYGDAKYAGIEVSFPSGGDVEAAVQVFQCLKYAELAAQLNSELSL
jgi:hypothetical protein